MRNSIVRIGTVAVLSAAVLAVPLIAQQTSSDSTAKSGASSALPEIDKIRTPQSPAFTVLGLAPTTIERPATPSKLALSLANSFTSADRAVLPKNYALEVSPFWMVSHPTLRASMLEDSFGARDAGVLNMLRRVVQNAQQTFTVGIAVADSAFKTTGVSPADTSIFRLGFGSRMTLFRGHWTEGCLAGIENGLAKMSALISAQLAPWIATHPDADANAIEAQTKAIVQEILKQPTKPQAKQLGDSLVQRDTNGDCLSAYRGFTLDAAGAGIGRFPAQRFDGGGLSAYMYWITAGYTWSDSKGLLAVLRAGKEGNAGKQLGASYTDLGGRLVIPNDDWVLSTEFVSRQRSVNGLTSSVWRWTGGFDYKVAADVWLNTSFGRDFQSEKAGSLLALINLQWSFGTKSLLAKKS